MVMAADTNCNAQHGVNDAGRDIFGTLLAGASILAAGYNSVRAVQLATEEWKMAKRYWRIAQDWLDYYRNWYAPVENQELEEARSLTHESPIYPTACGRARVVAWLEGKDLLTKSMRCTSKYCVGLRADMLATFATAQADALALADGLGYRNERGYVESRSDVEFEKKLNVIRRGRDMVADNISFAKATAGIYGDLFEQTWAGLEGAGKYLGYWSDRRATVYPQTMMVDRNPLVSRQQSFTIGEE